MAAAADDNEMIEFGDGTGIMFDTLGLEVRCKFNDHEALQKLQKVLDSEVETLKQRGEVKRIVCGDCNDFKVVLLVSAKDENKDMSDLAGKIGAIEGTTDHATQVYTFMTLKHKFVDECGEASTITDGVNFGCVAREIRCKFDKDKKEIAGAIQTRVTDLLERPHSVAKSKVYRIVCGGCGDFKIIFANAAANFEEFMSKFGEVEATFLEQLKTIPGTTSHETQTYTMKTC